MFSFLEWNELVVWVNLGAVRGYVPSYEDAMVMHSRLREDSNKFKVKISFKNLTSGLLNKQCHGIY